MKSPASDAHHIAVIPAELALPQVKEATPVGVHPIAAPVIAAYRWCRALLPDPDKV